MNTHSLAKTRRSSTLALSKILLRSAGRLRPARLMNKFSIDIADW